MTKSPNTKPRLSVNSLANYLVSSDTTRINILRQAKFPLMPNPLGIRYQDARKAICTYLTDPTRNISHITKIENKLTQRAVNPHVTCFRQNDAKLSIDVLRAILEMQNQISPYIFILVSVKKP
ncbi:MAG: hypothetical protein OXC62_15525 [Aestuariivita sp.]|nr:hypothetical protein [Aestuariivita sp.]